jgi:alanine-glyoxylate transaminase / serine-glyoxylate transaminase / serine-pyruvate transaminase
MLIEDEVDRLVMVPGPTPVHREILKAIAEPTIWHSSDAMADIVHACQEGIRAAAGAQQGNIFIFGGSGTLAQEAAVVNLVGPDDLLLVVSHGYFGDRFAGIAQAHGIPVERLVAPWGRAVSPDLLRSRLQAGGVRAVTITQVDTSTGTAAALGELVSACKEYDALVIVDSVCALGGMPVEMDRHHIDVVLTGAQKALGVPPGLAILAVSSEGLQRRRELARIPAYYADLQNWEASMENPQTYFSTHAVNLFYALARGLDIVRDEGLEHRFNRHHVLSAAFRAGMSALGFQPLTEPPALAPTLSVLASPDTLDVEKFRLALAEAGVVAAPNMGEFKGKGLRFGHMGNITESDILQCIAACEIAVEAAGGRVEIGTGVAAARRAVRPAAAAV